MTVLDTTGHTEYSWTEGNEDETEIARKAFNDLIAKGYTAFYVDEDRDDRKGKRMISFDADAGSVILFKQLAGG
jgi:hypothetical protein